MSFTVGSLYAGVGGIDKGLTDAGFDVVWANEVDRHACETYRLNHGGDTLIEDDVFNLDIPNLPKVDLLAAGFPCQPFSVAGYRLGFEDERGNHFQQIIKIAQAIRPKVLLLENVKNFRNHDKGRTYDISRKMIEELGYHAIDTILNTADYANIPQNRERFFLVAFLDETHRHNFEFPKKEPLTTTIHDFIETGEVAERFYYGKDSKIYKPLREAVTSSDTVYQWRRKYVRENKSNMCPTLTANMGTGGHNVPIILTDEGIRKLTPRECFRFQGFPEIKFPDGMAVSHLYKQAGNSVTASLIERLGKKIKLALSDDKSWLEKLEEFDSVAS
ncbi:MAG: DNA (cytosine-5-)-methyltransferase [Phototrophicaceae bacterium]